jgi:hypothetical protein
MRDQKVGDLPVTEKRGVPEFAIQVDAFQVATGGEYCLQGSRVVVVDEPLQQLDLPRMQQRLPVRQFQKFEYEVCPTTRDPIANSCLVH